MDSFGSLRRLAVPALIVAVVGVTTAHADPSLWKMEWGKTDFTRHSVDYSEIMSGGPPKDGIPSIDDPKFVALADVKDIAGTEPVIGFSHNGDARAYPLRILIWHEIVNDSVGGLPITVTYCPLCNSAIVFDRRLDGRVLDFGTTGKLRKSDLVMYDRQTESWWQQFIGEGIVGKMTGKRLKMLPARVESLANFRKRFKTAKILVPNHAGMRPYGRNPYAGYDSASRPFLYRGGYPKDIEPMAYVVTVGKQAWPLKLIQRKKTVTVGNLKLSWTAGQNSVLDSGIIKSGRDLGNLVVQKKGASGWADTVHDLTFAFVFHAFVPDGVIHKQ
ncbi:MAG: DUF3179 domain-containing protein [Rhodospirillales bacterium]|nr:DUF3179 domain-containing protein [Rhodospirillales bacterium]